MKNSAIRSNTAVAIACCVMLTFALATTFVGCSNTSNASASDKTTSLSTEQSTNSSEAFDTSTLKDRAPEPRVFDLPSEEAGPSNSVILDTSYNDQGLFFAYNLPAGSYKAKNAGNERTRLYTCEASLLDNPNGDFSGNQVAYILDAGETSEVEIPEDWLLCVEETAAIHLLEQNEESN